VAFAAFTTPSFSLFLSAMELETADARAAASGGAEHPEYLEFFHPKAKNRHGEV
jgi:hypothetical protein